MNTARRFAKSLTESIKGNEELTSKQCHYINITKFVALLIKQTVRILFYLVTFDPITLCDIKCAWNNVIDCIGLYFRGDIATPAVKKSKDDEARVVIPNLDFSGLGDEPDPAKNPGDEPRE